ncbi:phage tail protein [Streptomyces sp. NBC_01262]|uniref:phage tail protein n=1 Tax=Streptomyces sp. NBC_01262 TaxID=2903803 RepID=UPI002E33A327|nr:hypothetical protein [Streptomyces sp. NBC_01262]
MASDTSLVFNLVARDRATEALGSIRKKFHETGSAIATGFAGVGATAPAMAAAATAVGGLAAGAAAAGVAVTAFKVAAAPQLADVTGAWELYDQAQTAAAAGGDQAVAAQKAYAAAMAELPPATRATAREFIGLKSDFADWSDSLADTTMPVFTEGLHAMRGALPALTPLVESASSAIGGFVKEIAAGISGAGFKDFVADFAVTGGAALSDFLTVLKNVAVGVGSLLHAFLPATAGMTGGLATMSAAFASWARGLEGSAGFAKFLDLANSGKGALTNLGTAFGSLVVSLAPFMGATTLIAQSLADVIAAIPTPVITVLAKAFIAASVGMKAWALATAIWQGIQTAATAVQWAWNVAMSANPIALVIIGIVALVAVIVLIATKTTWFQTAWKAMSSAVVTAWNWVWDLLKQGFHLLTQLFLNFTGPGLIIKHWDTIKRATVTAWNAVWNFIKAIPGRLVQLFLNFTLPGLIIKHWSSIRSGTVRILTATVNWVKGLPGRFIGAVSSLGSRLYNAGAGAWNRFKTANAIVAGQAVSWARGLPGRIVSAVGNLGSRLYNAGRSLLMGFWNGIKSYASTLSSNVSGIVGKVRDYFPFSPAKKGPFSGSGYTTYSGQKLIVDFAKGITSRASTAQAAMTGVVAGVSGAGTQGVTRTPVASAPVGRGVQVVRVVVDVTRGDDDLKRLLRKWVRVDGQGNAQRFFGKGATSS